MRRFKQSVRGLSRANLFSFHCCFISFPFFAVGISLPFFCVISFDFNWSRSPKIQHPFALVCRCGLADIRRFVCADFRTDWDGSLEKWWWDAGTFSACKNFFSRPLFLCRNFLLGKSPVRSIYLFIYLFIYFSWGELEGGMCFCRNLNLDTRQNLNAWNRL